MPGGGEVERAEGKRVNAILPLSKFKAGLGNTSSREEVISMTDAMLGSNKDTNRTLEEELKASLVDGKLPCAVAFKIAGKLGVTPRQVGDTANKLNIKIVSCQLGCFP